MLKQLELRRLQELQDQFAEAVRKAVGRASGGVESGPLAFNSLAAGRLLESSKLVTVASEAGEALAPVTSIDELRGQDFYAQIRLIGRALDLEPDRWMAAQAKAAGQPAILRQWRAARFRVAVSLIRELELRGREAERTWRKEADARGVMPQTIIAEVIRLRYRTMKLYFIAGARRFGVGSMNSRAPLEGVMIQLIDGNAANG